MALIFLLCVLLSLLKTRGELLSDEQMPHRNVIDVSELFGEMYNCSQFTSCEACVSNSDTRCGFCSLLSNKSFGVCVPGDEKESNISCKTQLMMAFPEIEFSSSDPHYWFDSCPDNCKTDNDCHENATCLNTTAGFTTCVCNEFMKGNGLRCEPCGTECHPGHLFDEEIVGSFYSDDKECFDDNRKCPNVECVTTESGHHCRCKNGYKFDGHTCKPFCSQGCVHGTCVEKDVCACNFGFVGNNCSLRCECNGHSNCKDEENLHKCIECHNNTHGDQCQFCKTYFVGNAFNGGRCTSCLVLCNGHTDMCFERGSNTANTSHWQQPKDLNVHEGPQNDVACIHCRNNTEGDRCENCIPGYFKIPENPSACRPCQCHGHGDMCDPNTGESCNCANNTENDRQCTGKHSKNSVTPCWQLQCSKCKEYFLGVPTYGHQCYRHMFLDRDYCFDTETQEECNRKPNPLLYSRTVFFAVQPRYMNVDIRIVVDVSQGLLDFYLSAKEDTFVVDVNRTNGVHSVWLDRNYNAEYDEGDKDLIILRRNVSHNFTATQPGPVLKLKHYMSNGLTTYITVTNPNELLVVRSLESRLVITIPQEVHDLRSTRFYIILRGIASETFGNLFFRQDQSRIDLFVFFSVFFSCFFLFLASCVVVWKVKQAFDMRRARRLHAAEMKHMASRPFASVLVYLDSRSENDDFEFALSALSHHVHGKKTKASAFRIKGSHSSLRDSPKYHGPYTDSDHYFVRPVAVETTSEGQAAVVTTLVLLPGGSATPVRLTLASTLVSFRGSHQVLNQGNNPTNVGEVFRAAMKRRTTNSVI